MSAVGLRVAHYALRALAALSLLTAAVRAQDSRTVTEPKFPPACQTLTATLVPVADTTLEAVRVQQRHEQLEVLRLARVGRSGHQKQMA